MITILYELDQVDPGKYRSKKLSNKEIRPLKNAPEEINKLHCAKTLAPSNKKHSPLSNRVTATVAESKNNCYKIKS